VCTCLFRYDCERSSGLHILQMWHLHISNINISSSKGILSTELFIQIFTCRNHTILTTSSQVCMVFLPYLHASIFDSNVLPIFTAPCQAAAPPLATLTIVAEQYIFLPESHSTVPDSPLLNHPTLTDKYCTTGTCGVNLAGISFVRIPRLL